MFLCLALSTLSALDLRYFLPIGLSVAALGFFMRGATVGPRNPTGGGNCQALSKLRMFGIGLSTYCNLSDTYICRQLGYMNALHQHPQATTHFEKYHLFIEKLKINEEQFFDCYAQSQTHPQKLHLPFQHSLTTSYTYACNRPRILRQETTRHQYSVTELLESTRWFPRI